MELYILFSKRLGKKTIESNSISQSMSLIDYNGNKSTSLMARELMTPDEVKQLHYKTIIFPIIGYPIFRETVMYDKFSCYKSGEVHRTEQSLLDLSNTYFTVEQIKVSGNVERGKRPTKKEFNSNEIDEYEEFIKYEKKILQETESIINNIFKEENVKIEYKKTDNKRIYSSIIVNKDIIQTEKSKLLSSINDKQYHIEIQNSEDDKTIIEIYNKSPLINNYELEKDNKHE